jgi:ASPIC and UnbV
MHTSFHSLRTGDGKAVSSERRAQLLYYQDRMRGLTISSILGLLLAGFAVPEHSNPAFEVVRVLRSDSSPEPRSDTRVHFDLGSESLAKSIEVHWPSGTFQTLEDISGDPVLQFDEPARGAATR